VRAPDRRSRPGGSWAGGGKNWLGIRDKEVPRATPGWDDVEKASRSHQEGKDLTLGSTRAKAAGKSPRTQSGVDLAKNGGRRGERSSGERRQKKRR